MGAIFEPLRRLRLAVAAVALGVGGCGFLPAKPAITEKLARPSTEGTTLASVARASVPAGHSSGFRLLPDPRHALDARLSLVARAERTLDVQCYYIAGDETGQAFLEALAQAGERGVQVRLLVDDLHTAAIQPVLRALADAPNVEVRLFNPFCCGRSGLVSRFLGSPFELQRLSRRMHNKLMIVDGAFAVVGGRNIADEYFARGGPQEFVDLDALLAGRVVDQLLAIFMRYWDSEPAWPAHPIIDAPSTGPFAPGAAIRSDLAPAEHDDLLGQRPPAPELERGWVQMTGGFAYAFADAPTKVHDDDDEYLQASGALSRVRDAMAASRHEVVVSTPYLVPRARGMELVRHLAANGVRVVVLTNSMAANDSLFAHAGYARYRRQMLAAGMELYELSADRGVVPRRLSAAGRSLGRLHTKAVVVDRTSVYVGSVNFDPRSAEQNTELGVWIESPELARQVLAVMEASRRSGAYRVRLAPNGRGLQWLAPSEEGKQPVVAREPESTFWRRLLDVLIGPLLPESLL